MKGLDTHELLIPGAIRATAITYFWNIHPTRRFKRLLVVADPYAVLILKGIIDGSVDS